MLCFSRFNWFQTLSFCANLKGNVYIQLQTASYSKHSICLKISSIYSQWRYLYVERCLVLFMVSMSSLLRKNAGELFLHDGHTTFNFHWNCIWYLHKIHRHVWTFVPHMNEHKKGNTKNQLCGEFEWFSPVLKLIDGLFITV